MCAETIKYSVNLLSLKFTAVMSEGGANCYRNVVFNLMLVSFHDISKPNVFLS